jgi:hypothetical protein
MERKQPVASGLRKSVAVSVKDTAPVVIEIGSRDLGTGVQVEEGEDMWVEKPAPVLARVGGSRKGAADFM